uniref:RWP-RK domain-containing protein n=1 Tax=Percolomonas cosmopolitus TaxID=63605 RepID=A0A7S1KSV0_9EUKA|mmetsp:Transcript_7274/g.27233  ORF Transcript_7274/g.27233 Transcript_7274/m.27233 type:complete len:459 (+) Transcript_7274:352-1728(+)|eukprot:CAMPEP_0117443978 /NCGR_PEP_ID=MMETSP0759-20121206/4990_1 /TAXON_ID=63605 /ORGANISM="Percolomonas cosmopolitus, Strain WS" /LENGTH=458 /DNA_ID=CAMNT_0005236003 /DNA_START=262 /DNA_END=1638 /DNA_ORIENTATION=+
MTDENEQKTSSADITQGADGPIGNSCVVVGRAHQRHGTNQLRQQHPSSSCQSPTLTPQTTLHGHSPLSPFEHHFSSPTSSTHHNDAIDDDNLFVSMSSRSSRAAGSKENGARAQTRDQKGHRHLAVLGSSSLQQQSRLNNNPAHSNPTYSFSSFAEAQTRQPNRHLSGLDSATSTHYVNSGGFTTQAQNLSDSSHQHFHRVGSNRSSTSYNGADTANKIGEAQQQDNMRTMSPTAIVSLSSGEPSPMSAMSAMCMTPTSATTPLSAKDDRHDSSRRKRRRASRQFSRSEFMSVMHLTQAEAAEHFNVCLSTWKRQFCNLRPRLSWPGHKKRRILKKIRRLQQIVDELEEHEEVLPGKLFQFGQSIDDLYTHLVGDPRHLLDENRILKERVMALQEEIRLLRMQNDPLHTAGGTPMSSTTPPTSTLAASRSNRHPDMSENQFSTLDQRSDPADDEMLSE